MFEAQLANASTFKKVIDSIKDLVTDGKFDCSAAGVSLQSMDSSHVSLVAVSMRAEGFDPYRCDRNLALGINLTNLAKILKCGGNDDSLLIQCEENSDLVNFTFESKKQDKISQYEIKLMDLDTEHLGIPTTDYSATIRMPSAEFARICRDLAQIGDSVTITCTKESVQFAAEGDLGSGKINIMQNTNIDKEEDQVTIQMEEPVRLNFAVRFLNNFTKATPLSPSVSISMSKDIPLVVEYKIEDMGSIRFYLAPKIDDP